MMGYIKRNEVDTICTLTQYEINNKDTPFELSYPVYNVSFMETSTHKHKTQD